MRGGFQPAADGQTVHAREHQVQQDQVGRPRLYGGQRLLARGHARHLNPFFEEVIAHQLPDVLLVFHDENVRTDDVGRFDHVDFPVPLGTN